LVDVPVLRSVNVVEVSVAGSMACENVALTFVPTEILVAPGAGVRAVMAGAVSAEVLNVQVTADVRAFPAESRTSVLKLAT
jgi:hypothetical protein